MRCQRECYDCLVNLAKKNFDGLVKQGFEAAGQALSRGLSYLELNYSSQKIPATLAGEMQRIIRTESKNRDPFKSAKLREMILARQLSERYAPREAGLAELIKFAAKGNSLDFFMNIDQLQKEMQADVYFSINHIENLAKELAELGTQHGSTIVYLADNAGECYFDLPLIKKLEQYAAVYYAVKSAPVQNDLTLPDLMASGIKEEIPRVITTGTDTRALI